MIRRTTHDDTRALPAIERSAAMAFAAIPALAWLKDAPVIDVDTHRSFVDNDASFVAVLQEHVVGFVVGKLFADAFHVCELAVHTDAQRRGLGRSLMAQVVLHAQRIEAPAITLTTFRHVPFNAPFYASCGFRIASDDELPTRLTDALADEARRGLPRAIRCVMHRHV